MQPSSHTKRQTEYGRRLHSLSICPLGMVSGQRYGKDVMVLVDVAATEACAVVSGAPEIISLWRYTVR